MQDQEQEFSLSSPNTVLANALDDPLDLVTARLSLRQQKPEVINFYVGTQINGLPHIGTYLVQAMAFHLAAKTQKTTGIPTKMCFGALDNAPYKVIKDTDGRQFQMLYRDALGDDEIKVIVEKYYASYFRELSELTGVPFEIKTYTEQQADPKFRKEFLSVLPHIEKLGHALSPSKKHFKIRIPHQGNKLSEKHSLETKIIEFDEHHAIVESRNLGGSTYTSVITDEDNGTYLDINTLGRNLIKELVAINNPTELPIMVKGGDWVFASSLVDLGLGIIGKRMNESPLRMYAPQIVTPEGAKLSKSLIREGIQNKDDIPPYFLDMSIFSTIYPNTAEKMLSAVELFASDSKHLLRNYSYTEVDRILRVDSKYITATNKLMNYNDARKNIPLSGHIRED